MAEKADVIGVGLGEQTYCTAKQWIEKIEGATTGFKAWQRQVYGEDSRLHAEKRDQFLKVLRCYGERFGYDQKVIIVRAPGRINLMGRHADHRGGYNNFVALNRATIIVAGIRQDDRVEAVSTEPQRFAEEDFRISEVLGDYLDKNWVDYVNSDLVRGQLKQTAGSWGNYIRAGMVQLQHRHRDRAIRGMNVALFGDVPMAAGLSSSSTIVVASMLAGIVLNEIEMAKREFVELCGSGEWYVGSRGGMGDHAAIIFSERGKITQVGNHPFKVARRVDVPGDYHILIADSHLKAAKSAGAKDAFNARITSYNLGQALLKQRCPEIAGRVEHLRDVNPDRLGCSEQAIYEYLKRVPERMTREDFRRELSSEHHEMMERNFSAHQDPGDYRVRGVLLFGVAECLRSSSSLDLLERGEIARFGEMMQISHDGDRVSRADGQGKYQPWLADTSDAAMDRLKAGLDSGDERARLIVQPGDYACSTPEIDKMVDIACSVEGVVGAQMAGAGLGGSIMILSHEDSVGELQAALSKGYYEPAGLKTAVLDCQASAGACVASF